MLARTNTRLPVLEHYVVGEITKRIGGFLPVSVGVENDEDVDIARTDVATGFLDAWVYLISKLTWSPLRNLVDFSDELGGSCLSAEHHQSFVRSAWPGPL